VHSALPATPCIDEEFKKAAAILSRITLPPLLPLTVVTLGLAVIGWSLFDARLSDPPQNQAVTSVFVSDPEKPVSNREEPPQVTAPDEPVVLYPQRPELGDTLGTVSLPSLDLNWPVFEGTTEDQLSQGVGHFRESVLPGIRDNSVLSGHRTTVFGRLGELVEGDLILVQTTAGVFTYQVRQFQVVDRTNPDIIVPTPTAQLTLTTCYPFVSPIPTTQSFIVSADLIHSAWADHVTDADKDPPPYPEP
jgi:sortase A